MPAQRHQHAANRRLHCLRLLHHLVRMPLAQARTGGLVDIDRRTCIDCGMCIQVCAQGAYGPGKPRKWRYGHEMPGHHRRDRRTGRTFRGQGIHRNGPSQEASGTWLADLRHGPAWRFRHDPSEESASSTARWYAKATPTCCWRSDCMEAHSHPALSAPERERQGRRIAWSKTRPGGNPRPARAVFSPPGPPRGWAGNWLF